MKTISWKSQKGLASKTEYSARFWMETWTMLQPESTREMLMGWEKKQAKGFKQFVFYRKQTTLI